MKPFNRIPDRISSGKVVDLHARYDGTTHSIELEIVAVDTDGKRVDSDRYYIGDEAGEDDFLGIGETSTFGKLKKLMETIHTRAVVEAAPQ